MMSRFQRLLRAARHMFAPYHPIRRPSFATDDDLLARQLAQKEMLGQLQPRGNLKPTHSARWSFDANGSPIDYDNDGLPNG